MATTDAVSSSFAVLQQKKTETLASILLLIDKSQNYINIINLN